MFAKSPTAHLGKALVATTCLLLFSVGLEETSAQTIRLLPYTAHQRAHIRSLPITQRPSRPFHFYGNAVRRNAANNRPSGVGLNSHGPIRPTTNQGRATRIGVPERQGQCS
ncbi:hypothetical protein MFFC18_47810 [Mariniblastus fucicola]|uniref:Uncharacterized protein n=1 Tax=Mariniblastus fucicola TaxID=980251 RepID=A0A5B9PEM4_9BACT|nr:hypothetical protein MFFC18_47810 [Mariniblastus fucicola]